MGDARRSAIEEHEARTSSLERFAERKTAGGFGNLSDDQTALYCDLISAMAYTRELEAALRALLEACESGIDPLSAEHSSIQPQLLLARALVGG